MWLVIISLSVKGGKKKAWWWLIAKKSSRERERESKKEYMLFFSVFNLTLITFQGKKKLIDMRYIWF